MFLIFNALWNNIWPYSFVYNVTAVCDDGDRSAFKVDGMCGDKFVGKAGSEFRSNSI